MATTISSIPDVSDENPREVPIHTMGLSRPDDGYSQTPDRTSIIGAAKLTGKTQNGLVSRVHGCSHKRRR